MTQPNFCLLIFPVTSSPAQAFPPLLQIPSTVPELIVHILQSYQDHLRDMVTNFEVELDYLDQEIDSDDQIKAQLLENRRFSKMALDLQRVLQVR
jgi:hypothetical protein